MPIYLPPLNRRRFLIRAVLAGAALAGKSRIFAAEKPIDKNLFALLSDPHIADDPALVIRGTNMSANLTAVAEELITLPRRPAAVLVNGDCAYLSGKPEDYVNFVKLMQAAREAGMPLHMTLGNHDDREHFRQGVAEAKEGQGSVDGKHVAIVPGELANWFLLDSLEAVNKTPGSLGDEQLQWLAKALDKHKDKPAILLGHHNPHLKEEENKSGLKDTAQLLEIARPMKHVKAFIYGHTHNWEVKMDASGIHLINLPPVGYVFNPKRPNGWVEALVKSDGLRLKLYARDAKHPEAGEVKDLPWRAV